MHPEDPARSPPPPHADSPAPPPPVRRTLVVGGGRGGVGKSLLGVNLGVYLAQLGRSVVLADLEPAGANLHTVLGLDAPPFLPPGALGDAPVEPVVTTVPGLRMLPAPYDALAAMPLKPGRKSRWDLMLRRVQADYVLLCTGASMTPHALDLFLGADLGICVGAPEPAAIEATYRFCRALFARTLRRALRKERFKLRLVERVLAGLEPLPPPGEVIAALRRVDANLALAAASELARLSPRLVLSQTRVRGDLEIGPAMVALSRRFLGVRLDYLGHIEHDDAVWVTARRRRPLLIDSPTSKSARNLERIARRIVALFAAREARPGEEAARWALPPLDAPLTLYDVLGVPRTAADDEIRRAYKRQHQIFMPGSLPIVSLVDDERLAEEQGRIEEAFDTLLDPVRRRAYDLSTFPDAGAIAEEPARPLDAAAEAELLALQAEVAREIHPDTEFTGALLRKVRESQGVDLLDIARKTKISTAHLAAIEDEALADLPAAVYVRGFVQQIAKCLRLDPVQVARTYMRRLREVSTGIRARGGGEP